MIDQLLNYFSKIRALTKEEADRIKSDAETKTISKGVHVLTAGQTLKENYFILKGILRQYTVIDGVEKTNKFYTTGSWLFALIDENQSQNSPNYIECLEDCEVVIGDDEKGSKMMQEFPKFQEIAVKILEKEIFQQQLEYSNYINSTPTERYLELQKSDIDLINRIPQYILASYIGVQPESLSRIRKKITQSTSPQ